MRSIHEARETTELKMKFSMDVIIERIDKNTKIVKVDKTL